VEDPKVIYLGPACQKEGDGREWCEDDAWPQCECGCSSVRYVLESDAQSELAALREAYKGYSSKLVVDALNAELAALREDLEHQQCQVRSWKSGHEVLKQRLTAAEQRNASHESMLRHFASCADVRQVGTLAMDYVAALQPTESGASE